MKLLRARLVLVDARDVVADGGLVVAEGRVRRVLRSAGAVRRAESRLGRALDLGDGILAPGFVDAHVHLDLSALRGRLTGARGFVPWVGALVRERAATSRAELRRAALAAAEELLAGGTTSVGDVEATGVLVEAAGELPLRARIYREVLDAGDPERVPAALARLARALPRRRRVTEGVSPHAPHTTSDELLRAVRALQRRRGVPLTVHWAETEEEGEWLERGTGPWARLLAHPPFERGLARLERAGLLGPRTTLVHGNHPARGEPELLARRGVVLVHCPGSHAFFGRAPFPWKRYRRAGVALALGTDSLASNAALDLRREMRLAREGAPWLSPAEVFAMATAVPGRALGSTPPVGRLAPGHAADLALHRVEGAGARAALEEITAGRSEVLGVWVGGRRPARRSGSGGWSGRCSSPKDPSFPGKALPGLP